MLRKALPFCSSNPSRAATAWYVEAVKPSSLKACDDDLPKSVDTLEQHFADLTGRQTYFHMDERAAGSPQIATSRPISTIASRGSLKYSLTWTELRCIAANSASTHRGRRLSLSLGTTVSCPT
jgi:hypothetical protein